MRARTYAAILGGVAFAAVVACGGKLVDEPIGGAATCTRPSDYLTNPPDRLSAYCLLQNQNGTIVPAADVVPYDVNTPLFSDYAQKTRVIWVPPGATIRYDAAAAFDMPVGSIVAKTFALGGRIVETRVLMRRDKSWIGLPYVWNDAQDDAALKRAGETRAIDFVDPSGTPRTAGYLIASERDCHSCHDSEEGTLQLIGPSARQLNRDFAYGSGTDNQLAHWAKIGLLAGAPEPSAAPRLPVWSDASTGSVAERARAYLEANCAHCHSAAGISAKTNLFLRADEGDPLRFGVCKTTGDAWSGGGSQYDVVPGDPDHSVLGFRLGSSDPHVMMPQIGRSVVHTEGLALVRAWISGMPGSCASASAGGASPGGGGKPDAGAGGDAGGNDGDGDGDDGARDAGAHDAAPSAPAPPPPGGGGGHGVGAPGHAPPPSPHGAKGLPKP